MRVDDACARAGQRMRDRFAGQVPPAAVSRRKRRVVSHALVVGVVVAALAVGLVAVTRSDDAHEPARAPQRRWDRVSMRQAFGASTTMNDIVGARWGFVAAGGVPHGCPPGVAGWACQTNRLWYSQRGQRWTDVSFPALRAAQSLVTLGRVGDRALAIWRGPRGLVAWWSSDGRAWHRSTIRQPEIAPLGENDYPSWTLGAWSGGVVASELANGLESWVSRDGSVWTHVESGADWREPEFLFPQGVRIGSSWIAITGGLGVLSNGASSGVPQIMRSDSGRGWQPIDSDAPERLMPKLVPDARRQLAIAAQFRIPGVDPHDVGLFETRDGRAWTEIASFRQQFPAANPMDIAHGRGWWIVSGTNGPSGAQSTAVWISRDLTHWSAAPQRPGRFGAPGMLATSRSTAIALPGDGRWIRIVNLGAP